MESIDEHAATISWNVVFDIGRKSGESVAKFENLVDHCGDGIRKSHSSPTISDGGVDQPEKNRGHNYSNRHKQRVQELGPRRGSVGFNASMLVYHQVVKVLVSRTDGLHYTDEHENTIVNGRKTQ